MQIYFTGELAAFPWTSEIVPVDVVAKGPSHQVGKVVCKMGSMERSND
jgi:hypothetical protein